jgi:hypothetical protein
MVFSRFENREPQNVERPLRMPAVEDSIDADQENALQHVAGPLTFTTQTWNVAFHETTSCCLE